MAEKYRYAEVIFYPQNMVDNWQEIIDDVLQVPFCYAIHDKDREEDGSLKLLHGHLLLCWNNTVALDHFVKWVNRLSDPNKFYDRTFIDVDSGEENTISCPVKAASTAQPIINWERAYNYLIHDTESAKRDGKFLYPQSIRISGNNFDISRLKHIDEAVKLDLLIEISDYIDTHNIMDFITLKRNFLDKMGRDYIALASSKSGYLDRLMAGNYKKWEREQKKAKQQSQG